MNAVWLNDELMVAPATVAGLDLKWSDGDHENWFRKCQWYIVVVWISGTRQTVWRSEVIDVGMWEKGVPPEELAPVKAAARDVAEAEMGRLSALLWPPVSPGMLFVPEEPEAEPLLSNSLMGVASARARGRGFPKPPFTVRAEAAVAAVDALNGVVDGWCEGPNRQCGSMSNAGMRCKLPFGHELPHVDVDGWHWSVSDHI